MSANGIVEEVEFDKTHIDKTRIDLHNETTTTNSNDDIDEDVNNNSGGSSSGAISTGTATTTIIRSGSNGSYTSSDSTSNNSNNSNCGLGADNAATNINKSNSDVNAFPISNKCEERFVATRTSHPSSTSNISIHHLRPRRGNLLNLEENEEEEQQQQQHNEDQELIPIFETAASSVSSVDQSNNQNNNNLNSSNINNNDNDDDNEEDEEITATDSAQSRRRKSNYLRNRKQLQENIRRENLLLQRQNKLNLSTQQQQEQNENNNDNISNVYPNNEMYNAVTSTSSSSAAAAAAAAATTTTANMHQRRTNDNHLRTTSNDFLNSDNNNNNKKKKKSNNNDNNNNKTTEQNNNNNEKSEKSDNKNNFKIQTKTLIFLIVFTSIIAASAAGVTAVVKTMYDSLRDMGVAQSHELASHMIAEAESHFARFEDPMRRIQQVTRLETIPPRMLPTDDVGPGGVDAGSIFSGYDTSSPSSTTTPWYASWKPILESAIFSMNYTDYPLSLTFNDNSFIWSGLSHFVEGTAVMEEFSPWSSSSSSSLLCSRINGSRWNVSNLLPISNLQSGGYDTAKLSMFSSSSSSNDDIYKIRTGFFNQSRQEYSHLDSFCVWNGWLFVNGSTSSRHGFDHHNYYHHGNINNHMQAFLSSHTFAHHAWCTIRNSTHFLGGLETAVHLPDLTPLLRTHHKQSHPSAEFFLLDEDGHIASTSYLQESFFTTSSINDSIINDGCFDISVAETNQSIFVDFYTPDSSSSSSSSAHPVICRKKWNQMNFDVIRELPSDFVLLPNEKDVKSQVISLGTLDDVVILSGTIKRSFESKTGNKLRLLLVVDLRQQYLSLENAIIVLILIFFTVLFIVGVIVHFSVSGFTSFMSELTDTMNRAAHLRLPFVYIDALKKRSMKIYYRHRRHQQRKQQMQQQQMQQEQNQQEQQMHQEQNEQQQQEESVPSDGDIQHQRADSGSLNYDFTLRRATRDVSNDSNSRSSSSNSRRDSETSENTYNSEDLTTNTTSTDDSGNNSATNGPLRVSSGGIMNSSSSGQEEIPCSTSTLSTTSPSSSNGISQYHQQQQLLQNNNNNNNPESLQQQHYRIATIDSDVEFFDFREMENETPSSSEMQQQTSSSSSSSHHAVNNNNNINNSMEEQQQQQQNKKENNKHNNQVTHHRHHQHEEEEDDDDDDDDDQLFWERHFLAGAVTELTSFRDAHRNLMSLYGLLLSYFPASCIPVLSREKAIGIPRMWQAEDVPTLHIDIAIPSWWWFASSSSSSSSHSNNKHNLDCDNFSSQHEKLLDTIITLLLRHGAVVDNVAGDTITAVFGVVEQFKYQQNQRQLQKQKAREERRRRRNLRQQQRGNNNNNNTRTRSSSNQRNSNRNSSNSSRNNNNNNLEEDTRDPLAPLRAAFCALALHYETSTTKHLKEEEKEKEKPLLSFGVSRGTVFFGNLGNIHRTNFNITGPACRLAHSLCNLNKNLHTKILCCDSVARISENFVMARCVVFGRFPNLSPNFLTNPQPVYELLGSMPLSIPAASSSPSADTAAAAAAANNNNANADTDANTNDTNDISPLSFFRGGFSHINNNNNTSFDAQSSASTATSSIIARTSLDQSLNSNSGSGSVVVFGNNTSGGFSGGSSYNNNNNNDDDNNNSNSNSGSGNQVVHSFHSSSSSSLGESSTALSVSSDHNVNVISFQRQDPSSSAEQQQNTVNVDSPLNNNEQQQEEDEEESLQNISRETRTISRRSRNSSGNDNNNTNTITLPAEEEDETVVAIDLFDEDEEEEDDDDDENDDGNDNVMMEGAEREKKKKNAKEEKDNNNNDDDDEHLYRERIQAWSLQAMCRYQLERTTISHEDCVYSDLTSRAAVAMYNKEIEKCLELLSELAHNMTVDVSRRNHPSVIWLAQCAMRAQSFGPSLSPDAQNFVVDLG